MAATIAQLAAELEALIEALPQFTDRGFQVFNMDDLEALVKLANPPVVGIGYEGVLPTGKTVDAIAAGSNSAYMCDVVFSVTIAIGYTGAAALDDPKATATDLLDAIRSSVLGYKSVNTRPWRLVQESPQEGNLEGVVFYGQLWETTIPVIGNHQQ